MQLCLRLTILERTLVRAKEKLKPKPKIVVQSPHEKKTTKVQLSSKVPLALAQRLSQLDDATCHNQALQEEKAQGHHSISNQISVAPGRTQNSKTASKDNSSVSVFPPPLVEPIALQVDLA